MHMNRANELNRLYVSAADTPRAGAWRVAADTEHGRHGISVWVPATGRPAGITPEETGQCVLGG
jgi:hypothetical protein